MRYTVTCSRIDVIGAIWWPYGATCAMSYPLDDYAVGNARDEDGELTRDSVERWVMLNTGDFSSIVDWRADIHDETTDSEVVFDWSDPESELIYSDCMYGEEG